LPKRYPVSAALDRPGRRLICDSGFAPGYRKNFFRQFDHGKLVRVSDIDRAGKKIVTTDKVLLFFDQPLTEVAA
jgi:hypothetical protein